MKDILKLVAQTCASFASKNRVPFWILAALAALAILFGLVQSGYTPEESEGEIVITDSYGNVLTGEPEMQTPQEGSRDESH
ncbi:MAG: hypothetical protein ACI4QT_04120 [Kiritimatiellia bacterium]